MRRVVSLFLPTWPTDRWRRQNRGAPPRGEPLVTARAEHSRRVLAGVDAAAARFGLAPGMAVAHAQALVPELTVIEDSPAEDAEALERLAFWSSRYTPVVAPDPPDGILIDIAGAAHLHGGEAALLADLIRRLRRNGVAARGALAPTPAAAWGLARFSPATTILAENADVAAAIEPLPIAALRLPGETVDALRGAGFERIGDLIGQPKGPFIRRFGPRVMRRLAEALGQNAEPIEPLLPRAATQCKRAFAEPIADPDDLKRVVADLCGALCGDLEKRGLGARRLDLLFRRVDNTHQAIRLGLSRPSRDGRHLARLFAERLEGIDPGFGIEEAALLARESEALDPQQTIGRHVDDAAGDADLGELVDRVAVRIAAQAQRAAQAAVARQQAPYRLAPVESRIPERSVRRAPPLASLPGASWPPRLTRPHLLVDPPEPVVALNTDQPPRVFTWRGGRRSVVKADGPERIHGEWWVSDEEIALVRDYYRVETDAGERFWLFRDAPAVQGGRWFMHGVFA